MFNPPLVFTQHVVLCYRYTFDDYGVRLYTRGDDGDYKTVIFRLDKIFNRNSLFADIFS